MSTATMPLKPIRDCDAGDVVGMECYVYDPSVGRHVLQTKKRQVAMVVTAPRGRAVIFKPDSGDPYYDGYVPQSEAVRTFMEQHQNGR